MRSIFRQVVSVYFFAIAGLAVASAQTIHLNAADIHTGRASKQAPARAVTADFSGNRLHLVQFDGAIRPEWVEQLRKSGFRIVDFVPENAYLVYGGSPAVKSLRVRAKHVRWEGAYLAGDKIHPRARPEAAKARRNLTGQDDLFAIQLVLDEPANAETVALLTGLAREPLKRNKAFQHYRNLVVRIDPAEVEAVAERPDVISIAPYAVPRKFDERQGMIVAGQLAGNVPSGPGYLAWLTSKGFTQDQFNNSGIVVDVCDSGIDNGSTNANHFGLYTAGNTALASRVVYARLEGTPNSGSTIQGCDGHGTINAHIIGGYNNSNSGFPHQDSAGYRYGLGIAPYVKLGSSTIFDSDYFTSPDYEDMISRAYRDGAKISSDSWGADTYGGYDIDAQQYDALVRDAQQAGSAVSVAGNQEMTIVFAAGNSGSGAGTVGSPGTAKNVITVGAAENVHPHSTANGGNNAAGNDGCETPDSEANSANDVASFSSRGPCSDGRRKPEIMAPGTHVTGGVAQQVKAMAGNGNDIACFDGTGVCALPGGGTAGSTNNFFPLGQQWYTTSSGTSHSTPAVAGGAALVYQYFLNQTWGAPSPAMVKAYLMNSARYMTGEAAGDSLWSNNQGMGMMNLDFAFDGTARILRDQVPSDTFTASGQSRAISGLVADSGQPVRVTLSWTDAPGSTAGNAYKNNLDLTVFAGGTTYRGNVFAGAESVAGGTADVRNNTESVFLPAGTTGAVVVVVTGTNINSDGVPNVEPALDQDYALVIYNVDEVEMAVVTGEGSALVAESCGVVGNGEIDPDETVTVDFVLRNAGSADTTNVVATLLATGGVTGPDGPHSFGALLAGGASATQSFTFAAAGECGDTLTATLTLEDNGNDLGMAIFEFRLGGTTDTTQSLTNATAITLSDNASASPYPSTITVADLPGTIANVTATLRGFAHTWPSDVDVILVSPDGQTVSLMGAAGGGTAVSGATLTFDDDAASAIGGIILSGTYQPSGMAETMNAPAPAPPYGSALADLNGGNPNGIWKLYALDAAEDDTGSIAQGWSITVTAAEPLCCGSNKPPVFGYLPNQGVIESNLLSFAVIATDPYDGDPIALTASNLPAGSAFGATNGVGQFLWESPEPTGTYSVIFYAEDKDGTTEKTIAIDVHPTPYVDTNCWVLISEYVEGSSNNKALEIYNPTAEAIDLTAGDYVVQLYFNGNTTFTAIPLAGTIPAQGVFVLANSSAAGGILGVANQASAGLTYNGNDAVVLRVGGTNGAVLDCIGQVGFDPGTEWGSGLTSTADNTIRRKPTVKQGNTNLTAAFDPATEWDGYAVDTFDGLGTHTSDCSGPGLPTPPVLNPIGNRSVLPNATLQFQVVATPTDEDEVTLSATNLPAGAVFNSTNEIGTFLWENASPTGTYSVTFYAEDKDGTSEETILIVVGEEPPPADATYLETFDNTSYWAGGAAGSYNAKTFANPAVDPAGDSFESPMAIRDTVESVSSNAWRLSANANNYLRYVVSTNVSRVAVQMARWDNSPTPVFEVRYSTDGGATYTVLLSDNGSWFNADKAYKAFDSGAVDIRPVGGQPVWIEIFKATGERFLIDNFEIDYGSGAEPPVNVPPVLGAISNRSVALGEPLQFQVSAAPTDGDPVTLSASNLPGGAVFNSTNEIGTFLWETASPTGTYSVTFHAEDKDGTDEKTMDITVYEPGTELLAPVIQAASLIQAQQFNANWLASAGATGYVLDVGTNETFTGGGGSEPGTNCYHDGNLGAGTGGTWTETGLTQAGGYVISQSGDSLTTPAMDFTVSTAETLNFKARTYGGVNAANNTITVSISTDNGGTWSVLGTRVPLNTTLTAMTPFDLSSYDAAQVKVKLETLGATVTVGAGLDDVLITNMTGGASAWYVPGYENLDVGDVTTAVVTGLTEGVTYYYRAQAYNAVSNSPYSAVTSVVTAASSGTPPVLNPIGGQDVFLGETLQFQVSAAPTEADAVTLTASNVPPGAVFYPTNEVGTFLWVNASPTGEYSVVFWATDKDGTDGEAVGIYVYALPQVGEFVMSNGTPASATIQTVAGRQYRMEYTLDLAADPVVWGEADSETGTGGSMTLEDADNALDIKRYYRIVAP